MKYYLMKHELEASIGGCDESMDIVDVSYDRESLIERMSSILGNKRISEINDEPADEFEFDESDSSWKIIYETEGMVTAKEAFYQILERDM